MDGAIDVYTFRMDEHTRELDRFAETLSRDERDRAERFRTERDRRRYIVRRGILRELLAHYLDCPPARVRFSCNEHGKPSVRGGNLRFNLAHSHGLVLFAIGRGREIGCDIEWRDCRFVAGLVPERFFSPLEVRTLRALAPARQTEGFFNCWTRKEAYVKALGVGLSCQLRSFDVSLAPDEPAALLNGCDGWSVQSFEPAPRYQAAIVAQGTGWRLNLRRNVGRLRVDTAAQRLPESVPLPPAPATPLEPALGAGALRAPHRTVVGVREQPAMSGEVP